MWIFVSHSTEKGDDAGKRRLLDLKTALEAPGAGRVTHDVLLDFERLDPGVKWRDVIDEWLATCNAAVLMLTPKALSSAWVLKEATILAHRAARDQNFLLFPVLLDGLTRETLIAQGSLFSPLYLDAIQRVNGTTPAAVSADVRRLIEALPTAPERPFEKLVATLTVQLKTAGGTLELEQICAAITGKPVAWSANEVRAERCAREIARAVVSGQKGGYATLDALIGDLLMAGLTRESAGRVLKLVAPLWVDAVRAAPLAELAARNLAAPTNAAGRIDSWSTAITCAFSTFTTDKYVRRAYLPGTAVLCTLAGAVNDDWRLDTLVDGLRAAARSAVPLLLPLTPREIDTFLARVRDPWFILLPPPLPDEALLAALQKSYPKLTFIGVADQDGQPLPAVTGRMVPLVPAVDPDRESQEFQDYVASEGRISRV